MESGQKSPRPPGRLSRPRECLWNGSVFAAPLEDGKRVGEFPREQAVASVRRTHVALKGPMATAVAHGRAEHQRRAAQGTRFVRQSSPGAECRGRFFAMDGRGSGHRAGKYGGSVCRARAHRDSRRGREPENYYRACFHAHCAFCVHYARKNGRKKIHAIHKANIMKLSDGLFLEFDSRRGQGISGHRISGNDRG